MSIVKLSKSRKRREVAGSNLAAGTKKNRIMHGHGLL
ncbi:hypothetical protein EZS27_026086 [termite gut metagenome]|uniref:Uncharacterized protein n=1 Tax=termite gut metagenome TaxID=433724 RepID=A0A5J4QSV1_9ZZZZ